MEYSAFEKLIDEALSEFPAKLRKAISNVAIVIEPQARRTRKNEQEIHHRSMLLGLYEGVPQSAWGRRESGILPDKITIFQEPIESLAHDEKELKELVKDVVWHELGHHFGFTDAELRKIEARRRK